MSNRRTARRILSLLGLAVVVAVGAYLLAPRRVTQVATIDGGARWNAADAPPRRQIVWQPAEAIAAVGLKLAPGDSLIRPQLADGGSTLFFTLRRAGGDANIFRSRLIAGIWQEAIPVDAINSDADDIGPIVSQDGQTLYLYSNRPGGFGGFDLFASRRTAESWSRPENLGAQVNSAADEYDPAVSPDGTRLFYSSNRSHQLQQRIVAEGGVKDAKDWPATLRAQAKSATFDLYLAERDGTQAEWQVPRPLAELNRNDASDGTPFVSSNGAFLYFASDRPRRAGGSLDFDIYRARIVGSQFVHIENLGSGVNSSANELEPALSHEGFRLLFSRNVAPPKHQTGQQYALYASTATEITETTSWDNSNLWMPLNWIMRNWSWMILAALLCGLLAGLIWYLRQVSMKRATVPGFFLCALVIHLLLVGSLFVVALDDDLRNRLQKEVQELVVAVQLDDNPQPMESTPEYGNQADSQQVETIEPAELQRQTVVAPPVEAPSENPRPAPPVPSQLPFVVPREQIVTSQPQLDMPADVPTLARRNIERNQPVEMVETIDVQPAEATAQSKPTQVDVDLQRTRPPVELAASPKMQKLPDAVTPLRSATVPVERTAAQPATSSNVAEAPMLTRKAAPDVALAETKVETTELAEGQPSNSQMLPASVAVDVARQPARNTASLSAGLPPRRTMPADTPTVSSESLPVQRAGDQPVEIRSPSQPSLLARADRTAPSGASLETVPTESVAGPITPPATVEPASVVIEVARQANSRGLVPLAATTPTETTLDTPLEAAEIQPFRSALELASANPADVPTSLAMLRRPAAAEIESASEPIDTLEQAAGVPGGEANIDPSQTLDVRVQRTGEAAPVPKSLPAGLTMATDEHQLTADLNAIEVPDLGTIFEPRAAEIEASIARVTAAVIGDEAEPIDTLEQVAQDSPPMELPATTGVAVAAERAASQIVESISVLVDASGSSRTDQPSRLAMAALVKDGSRDAPEFGPSPSSLARNTARAARLPFAEDDIGLQAMLRLRQSEAKQDLLEAFGGNSNSEAAVERGLNWIELHQHDEGQWSLNRFTQLCEKHHKSHQCNGAGGPSDTAATGFALLPFLGAGHTHQDGQHQEAISRGLKWLVANQKPDGDLFVGGTGNSHMYSHGIATIALCEAYAMTRDPVLREPAQKAINFIVAAQHPTSGGWRYTPRQDGDTSVFGWQVMALKSGQMAELTIPQATLDKAKLWLAFTGGKGANEGRFGYTNNSPTLTMTAEALLCLQYLGGERNDPRLIAGSKFLAENLPTKETSYYWYYGTQVMFHMQGEPWRKWNAALQNSLVETQVKEGSMAGTWDPRDNWEKTGGRVYATALRLLMLEVYYRHLPLYQVLDQ